MKRPRWSLFLLIIMASILLTGCQLIKYGKDNIPTPVVSSTDPPTPSPTVPATTPVMQAKPEPITCYVNGTAVRIRASASTDAEILDTLSHQTPIQRLDVSNGWCKVQYKDITGYIYGDLISTTLPTPKPTANANIEFPVTIVIKKADRKLELWLDGKLHDTYNIGLGWTPEGDKLQEGDGKTPEGEYYVCVRNRNSNYYRSLGVSYPNKEDAKRGLEAGIIDQNTYGDIAYAIDHSRKPSWSTAMGGAIMIHGHGGERDWTAGCIAVDDSVMDILWEHCSTGTPIIIQP